MPKHTSHTLTWCDERQEYEVCDPEHTGTLATTFGLRVYLTPDTEDWYAWLHNAPSFAFAGREGRCTARKEVKQRGDTYWSAYQRVCGKLQKKYLGKTCELTAEKMETVARAFTATTISVAPPPLVSIPKSTIPSHAWTTMIAQETMIIDIGKEPQEPPYDDTYWLPDRSHFPLLQPTKDTCLIHPASRWLLRDPTGQAWCTNPTCWRRYNLMRLGGLLKYRRLLGYGHDTQIDSDAVAWSIYTDRQDDEHIAFALRQALQFCNGLGLPILDLSENARLHAPMYDSWISNQPRL